jgi:energy-coupling factor transport system permease protein
MAHFLTGTLLGRSIVAYLIVFVVPLVLPVVFIKLIGIGGIRDLLAYEPKDTVLHRLDPRLKLIFLGVVGVLSVMLGWQPMLILFVATIIPWALLRPSWQRTRLLLIFFVAPAVAMFWSQGLYNLPPNGEGYLIRFPWTVSWVGTPGLATYGMVYGLEQIGRVLLAVSASLLVLLTTDVTDMTWALEHLGLPPRVGFAFNAALRFLPEMLSRTTLVLRAVELRGYDLSRPRWYQVRLWPDYVRRISRCVPIVTVPLLIGSLRGTTTMAMVADARAFGMHKRRTYLREHVPTRADYLAWTLMVLLIAGAIIAVLTHFWARPYGG